MMETQGFDLDVSKLRDRTTQTDPAAATAVWEAIRRGATPAPLDLTTLWPSDVDTADLYAEARRRRERNAASLETFSPLYMTNTCDAECLMCGMRRGNTALIRETAPIDAVIQQLHVLKRRGMHAVALLTGEYRAAQRPWAMGYINQALRAALDLDFRHILINVGSIDTDEFDDLFDGIPRRGDGTLAVDWKVSMSTFQETYDPDVYSKFMGSEPDNPRANFQRRLVNFDRAFDAGLRVANPGILVGLNANIAYEMTALALHTAHLQRRGMEVYLSVPRLRRIAGEGSHHTISDDDYVRMVSLLSLALPAAKPVVTTRESATMQEKLAPVVSVISAGSASVAPYTTDGARFPLETSQFEVIDQRPFEAILQDHRERGIEFENFRPA